MVDVFGERMHADGEKKDGDALSGTTESMRDSLDRIRDHWLSFVGINSEAA